MTALPPHQVAVPQKRRLMITVDVEAQPGRAERDHVDRLIWGRYPEGRAGIGEMMDISEKHGVKLTMFLDYCEEHLYGNELLDVGREIHRRGHDLQLHAHLEFLGKDFWLKNKLKPEFNLNELDADQASAVFDFLCDRHQFAVGSPATSFRGGGYRFNDHVLNALISRGAPLDSSVNVSRKTQPATLPLSKQFDWSNGSLEVPVSCIRHWRNYDRLVDLNFNSSPVPDARSLIEYLDTFYRERGDDAIAVLVMHSWSFLKLNDKHFTSSVPGLVEKYVDFLELLRNRVTVITASDVLAEQCSGRLQRDPVIDTARLRSRRFSLLEGANTNAPIIAGSSDSGSTIAVADVSSAPAAATCPICGAEQSRFVKLNGRQCPDCGSLEGQRAFAVAYESEIRRAFDVRGKTVLIFRPAVSEVRFLASSGVAGKISVDVRPENKPDIQADVCAMPQVATASQEFVFASYLMPVVHDMNAALDEIARVLQPGGTFVSIERIRPSKETVEHTDEAKRTAWYGKENYEKYRIGRFRTLGEDYLHALSARFAVATHTSLDPITGATGMSYVCTKVAAPSLATLSPVNRTLAQLLDELAISRGSAARDRRILAHTLNSEVRNVLRGVAKELPTVIDSWRQLANSSDAAIAASLSGFADATVDLFVSVDVLDFLQDIPGAIASIARVVRPDGTALIRCAAHRIVDGYRPPVVAYVLNTAASKLPPDAKIPSMVIGRDWLLQKMTRVGFEAKTLRIRDIKSGQEIEWFVGRRLGPEPCKADIEHVSTANAPAAVAGSGGSTPSRSNAIGRLRRQITESALRPYDNLDASHKPDSPHFRKRVEDIIENGWERWSVSIDSIRPPIPWDGERGSFDYSLHAFEPLNHILRAHSYSGERRYLEIALDFALDWCAANQASLLGDVAEAEIEKIVNSGSRAVWLDMAVGQRIYRLAYLLDIAARVPDVSDDAIRTLLDALDFHHRLLSQDAFFTPTSNHGVYQALGQLAAARRFSWYPPYRPFLELAANRVRELVNRQFTASGVHREHSPGYHYMVMGSYIGAIASGVVTEPDIVAAIGAMEEALSWMIKPDGMIVTMGDSDPRTLRGNVEIASRYQNESLKYLVSSRQLGVDPGPGVRSYPDAGYVFARLYAPEVQRTPENATYLAQMAGFHSRVHKHADHLSFVWYDRNRDILIDPGRYAYTEKTQPGSELHEDGFWYADPKRIYCEMTRSHNTVEIDGKSYPRAKVKPFGSALVYAGEQDGLAITVCAVTHFRSIRHHRQLVMSPGHFLLVLDWLYDRSAVPHDYRQWFHFADSWQVNGNSDLIRAHHAGHGSLAACDVTAANLMGDGPVSPVVRGQTKPDLLGWLSDEPYNLIPTSCFNVHAHSTGPAQLATLFVFGNTLEVDRKATRFNRSMKVGEVVWTDERGPQRLRCFDLGRMSAATGA